MIPTPEFEAQLLLLLPRDIYRQEVSYDKRGTEGRLGSCSYDVEEGLFHLHIMLITSYSKGKTTGNIRVR